MLYETPCRKNQIKTVYTKMIQCFKPHLFGNENKYLDEVLKSTWISAGQYVEQFEKEFSCIIGRKDVITVSNGTIALHLALLGLDIGKDDEVIVPDYTFVSPGNAVLYAGAEPVFADIDKDTWCIDAEDARKKITSRTKAIIAVHIYGNVCDMSALEEIVRQNDLFLVEDTAESVFSKYNGKPAGSFGDVGCFSFQAAKTITMGEGGAIATDDSQLAEKMRKLRSHGMSDKRYWHDMVGYNYRLTNLQAALGCSQLENLEKILFNKKKLYDYYKKRLEDIDGITFQTIPRNVEPVMWAVSIKIDPRKFKGDRDAIMKELLEKGIETRPGFYPFTSMPLYKPYKTQECRVAESISKDIIVLPSYSSLSEEEIDYVCSHLKGLLK